MLKIFAPSALQLIVHFYDLISIPFATDVLIKLMKPNTDEIGVITFTKKNNEINNIYKLSDKLVTRTVCIIDLEVLRILIFFSHTISTVYIFSCSVLGLICDR